MDKETFVRIRKYLGKSQSQLARLLCVSLKTIQSFEQGWRNISTPAERQLIFLLSLKRTANRSIRPCWEILNCPDYWKTNCSAWELKACHLCWYITGTYCHGEPQDDWAQKIDLCRQCEVYRLLIPSPTELT